MSLMRWDPIRGISFWNGARVPTASEPSADGLMDLTLDMYETNDSVVVELPVPGIDPQDLQVRVTGNRLTVEGKVQSEHKAGAKNYVLKERRYGRFYRSVLLPESVKAGDAQAEFENGVLKLTVPKLPEAKPMTVQVKAK